MRNGTRNYYFIFVRRNYKGTDFEFNSGFVAQMTREMWKCQQRKRNIEKEKENKFGGLSQLFRISQSSSNFILHIICNLFEQKY